ncbi:MAG TPA: M20/M25/M40 family metallo-hydrolase [Thermoanaerobaculia bacterium]|nr:M20/M25/M40 family metallo-hydrolase [Thermoanaerobaculia bacterium]HUM30280.1 M20/M25/M40 family metallo-hydrolase [Thermoanaerobaculia bacterium]HXK68424.1 M20/M25/M40 family metallo-hydrolase [Thermoanaerobaculia bacterium]
MPNPDVSRMVNEFMDMVRIDSESGEEARMVDHLLVKFRDLGATAEKDAYGNLIAHLPARGTSCTRPILLSCHADTVKPGKGIEPVLKDGVIRSSGDTILGADDKAGIAEMIETIRIAEIHPPLEIAISRQEEVGLLGVKNLDYSRLTATRGFLLDNDTLDTIVIGGPSYFAIDAVFHGRSAHAGMEPEKGINAIAAAARALSAIDFGRVDKETTCNVGVIQGGSIRNGVPDRASIMAECRSLDHDKGVTLAESIRETLIREGEVSGAKVEVEVNNLCRSVLISEDSWTVNTAKEAFRRVGIEASTTLITGFTDASIYNNHGIEMAVIGIGARMEHSTDEHIHVEDMERAVLALLEIFKLSCD